MLDIDQRAAALPSIAKAAKNVALGRLARRQKVVGCN